MTSQPDMQGLDPKALEAALTRPIIGIENRTPQEAFDIMADRFRSFLASLPQQTAEPVAWMVTRPGNNGAVFPRFYLLEEEADSMVAYVTINPPATKVPLYTRPASPPVGGTVKLPWPNVHEYVESYEWRGDGDYTPTDEERALIEDAINGYIGEVEQRTLTVSASSERSGREAALIEAAEELLEHMDDYGHIGGVDVLPLRDALAALSQNPGTSSGEAGKWHDIEYLMSIIDAAIEDGFDPDEDGPLLDEIRAEVKAGKHRLAALASSERSGREAVVCSVKTMKLSDGREEYYVAIRVGDREITPYRFTIKGRAEFEVAELNWLLNGAEKPDILDWLDRTRDPSDPTEAAIRNLAGTKTNDH